MIKTGKKKMGTQYCTPIQYLLTPTVIVNQASLQTVKLIVRILLTDACGQSVVRDLWLEGPAETVYQGTLEL